MEQFTSAHAHASSAPPAPDFSADRQALLEEVRGRTNNAYDARMLLDLLQWIENAREVVERVQQAATYFPEFRQVLDDQEIAYNLPWEESDGLCRVISIISELNRT